MSQKTQSSVDWTRGWAALTWDDLVRWAGSRSVERGRSYQRSGQVKNLALSDGGKLLATVIGGERYTVIVSLNIRKETAVLDSQCTCPVGANGCKHAVAVVADLLEAVASGTRPALATADDKRWSDVFEDSDDDDTDDDDDDDEEDEEDEVEVNAKRKPRSSNEKKESDWAAKIDAHLRAKSVDELVAMVVSLTERFPELRDEFQERIALKDGNVDRLLAQARKELKRVTAESGWADSWNDAGYIPDYGKLQHQFERLLELGHFDAIAELGSELLGRGMTQIEQTQDEGETAMALAESFVSVFQAVAKSTLSNPQKILYAIDAHLHDDYGVFTDETGVILNAPWTPADWSAVADELAGRLDVMKSKSKDGGSRDYHRDQVTNWLFDALGKAGRDAEKMSRLEIEAQITGSYERLVKYLMENNRNDDAERWAREGIEKTREQWPGISNSLAKSLCEIARGHRKWDVVAAHAAAQFFDEPSVGHFKELMKAAQQAGCEDRVRATALIFLETATPVCTSQNGKTAIASNWPLPVPDYLVPDFSGDSIRGTKPRVDVLLDLAIAEKRSDDVLRWYEKMQPSRAHRNMHGFELSTYAGKTADAVAESHPERALQIYMEQLSQETMPADQRSYEAAGATLRKMRPVFKRLNRENEWSRLVEEIRAKHRNRRKFIEVLDRLESRPIVETCVLGKLNR